jgi:hypothetical protein
LWSDLTSFSDENVLPEDLPDESLSNSKTHILLRAIHQNNSRGATAAEIYENIINSGREFDRADVSRILAKQVSRGRVRKDGFKAFLTEKGLQAISHHDQLGASIS